MIFTLVNRNGETFWPKDNFSHCRDQIILSAQPFDLWKLSFFTLAVWSRASQMVSVLKNLPAKAGDIRDAGSIPGSGRSPGGGPGNPLQYSCLENLMDGEPGRLQSIGLQRVRHNWSDLAHICDKNIFFLPDIVPFWALDVFSFHLFRWLLTWPEVVSSYLRTIYLFILTYSWFTILY